VSVEVLEGGIGCVLTRAVPGLDPSYSDARGGFLAYCDERDVTPPLGANRPYEALTHEGTPLVADDATVSAAAAHAARVVIDILKHDVENLGPQVLLIGFRKQWIFEGHGHSIGIQVPQPERQPDSGAPSDAARAALDFVKTLVEEAASEVAPSS
jgi:hypothetical protein